MFLLNNKKAQTSIEFVVVVAIILILVMASIVQIFSTFDSTSVIYNIKNQTFKKISSKNLDLILENVSFTEVDKNINMTLRFNKTRELDYDLNSEDYNRTIENLLNKTKYDNINLEFIYN